MKQIIPFGGTFPGSTGWFANPLAHRTLIQESPEAQALVFAPTAGTVRNFRMRLTTAPGSGTSRTLTWRKNGSAQSLAVTVSDTATEGTDTSNSFTVAAGDTLSIAETRSGAPAGADCICTWEFEPTDANESIYGFGGVPQTASARYTGLFWGASNGGWPATVSGTAFASLAAMAGTVDGYRIRLTNAPGSGKSWAFAIYKNGTKQDGTGGTTDTTGSIADTATSLTWSGSLAISPGDWLEMECVPSGTPAATRANGSVVFSATSAGQGQLGCSQQDAPTGSTTEYYWAHGSWAVAGTGTEASVEMVSNPTTLTLSGLRFRVLTTVSTESDLTCTLRKNRADTVLTVTRPSGSSQGETVFSGSDEVAIADGDEFDIAITAAGSVHGSTRFQVSFAQGVVPLSERNLLTGESHTVTGDNNVITGSNGTVVGDNSELHNLDGTTRTLTANKTFAVYADEIRLNGTSFGTGGGFDPSSALDGLGT